VRHFGWVTKPLSCLIALYSSDDLKPSAECGKPLLLFDGVSRDALLSYGVPEEWTDDVLAATEDTLFGILDHIRQEAAESLMTLATGGTPVVAMATPTASDPFAHPDAQRRFRVMNNVEELERALEFPWEKWSVFLHPSQRELVERQFNRPARVAGSTGTGKTVVALHRAVYLARSHPDSRVVATPTSFSRKIAASRRTGGLQRCCWRTATDISGGAGPREIDTACNDSVM
jgi:hypothetical protein